MQYPKQRMSVSELVDFGFSRYELNQIISDPNAPVQWTAARGKAFIDTSKLDEYLKRREMPKEVPKDVKVPWSKRKSHLLEQVTQNN